MTVALNICGKNIKVVSLEGRRVKKWGSVDVAPGLVRDGLILQPKTIGESVNNLFKETGVSRDKVVSSVAGVSFTYRFITLPRLNSGQLEEAVLRAASKEISIPIDELYISWQRLPDVNGEMSFFVLGLERHRVDALIETLQVANIEPYLMGIRPLALARIAERKDAIIVNVEECCFDIVFLSDGIPRIIHTISPRETSVTLEDNIRRLADELTKTAAFYRSSNPDVQLDEKTPLLLTGDWAAEPATSALLQTEVDYPISHLVAQVEVPQGLPMDSFAAVIGLALKKKPAGKASTASSEYTDINVNAFAGKFRKSKAKPVPIRQVLLWILLAAAVFLVYPLYQVKQNVAEENNTLQMQLTDIQRQITFYNVINEDYIEKENQMAQITTETLEIKAAYQATLANRDAIREQLQTVSSLIPENAVFTSMEIGNGNIYVYGEADTTSTVITYASELENLGVFKSVRINALAEEQSILATSDVPPTVIQFLVIVQLQ